MGPRRLAERPHVDVGIDTHAWGMDIKDHGGRDLLKVLVESGKANIGALE
jgi:hypothetical protein